MTTDDFVGETFEPEVPPPHHGTETKTPEEARERYGDTKATTIWEAIGDNQTRMSAMKDMIDLPVFAYNHSIDNVCYMLGIDKSQLRRIVFRKGVDIGQRPSDKLEFHNIAPYGEKPIWVCDHAEFRRWARRRGQPLYAIDKL